VGDAAPALGLAARAIRVLALLGNAFLVILPLSLFFSSRRSDAVFLVIAGYCATVAVTSTMALAFRDRFSFWAALGANVVGVLLAAVLLIYFAARGDADWWAVLFIAVPTALNLLAVLLVRRSRGPSDDTVASRR
jgi:1,4-dihydroxy-2-naphthoate octaprenyltransferase